MPEFPPTQLPASVEQQISETNRIAKASIIHLAPIAQSVNITADGQEITVIDTSQIEIVNNKPHTLMGWIDMSNFAALAQSNPDATIEVRWYVDGKLYRVGTYSPSDFQDEPLLLFLERAATKFHKVTVIAQNTGASDQNPLTLDYSFEIRAAFQPWSQLV